MNDDATQRGYGIGELADAAGVSRRTVRYYIQEDLLEAPVGLGRSAFYTDVHLERLRRIKALQEDGLTIGAIRAALGASAGGAPPPHPARRAAPPTSEPTPPPTEAPPIESWARLPLGDGVELHVRIDRMPRVPMELVARLAAAVRGDSEPPP